MHIPFEFSQNNVYKKMEMLTVKSLDFGFNDAINYNNPDKRNFFNKIFVQTNDFENLLKSTTFFLLGEKGTGKTAYAVYLSNNDIDTTRNEKSIITLSTIYNIKSTDYLKFIAIKKESNLLLSDFVEVWKVILYLIISQKIKKDESVKNIFWDNSDKFNELENAINEYNSRGFAPEISIALSVIEELKAGGEITLSNLLKAKGESNLKISSTETVFQKNLFEIKNKFEEALFRLELNKDHILFIDGLDTVPQGVKSTEYLECLRGLGEAVWFINHDFFSKRNDKSCGRIKIILLMRPDIFIKLNLQNQNSKIRDNSVLLDTRTNYGSYRNSYLFKIIDRLLSTQQLLQLPEGMTWNYYFPFTKNNNEESFKLFLRLSMGRPRDIITMMSILKEVSQDDQKHFTLNDFESPLFKTRYANYLMAEVKEAMNFSYSNNDFDSMKIFFTEMGGKSLFSYDDFLSCIEKTLDRLNQRDKDIPIFFDNPVDFLQLLYDLNIICYRERMENKQVFYRWSYQEKSTFDPRPEVRTGLTYEVHPGLSRALNVGIRQI